MLQYLNEVIDDSDPDTDLTQVFIHIQYKHTSHIRYTQHTYIQNIRVICKLTNYKNNKNPKHPLFPYIHTCIKHMKMLLFTVGTCDPNS